MHRGGSAPQIERAKCVIASPLVTPEQMEMARLRAELARMTMERDIAKKAAAYFAQDLLQSTPGFKK